MLSTYFRSSEPFQRSSKADFFANGSNWRHLIGSTVAAKRMGWFEVAGGKRFNVSSKFRKGAQLRKPACTPHRWSYPCYHLFLHHRKLLVWICPWPFHPKLFVFLWLAASSSKQARPKLFIAMILYGKNWIQFRSVKKHQSQKHFSTPKHLCFI